MQMSREGHNLVMAYMEKIISIVIPVLNEEVYLPGLLRFFAPALESGAIELIVVDGGSSDNSREIAATFPGVQILRFPEPDLACRATQMNFGAERSHGELLWFVHADSLPPPSFPDDLWSAVQRGHHLGGYAFDFDSPRPLLRLNSWFTRLNWSFTRGGDQTLFVSRTLWEQLSGYRPDAVIMEEYDLIDRAAELGFSYHRLKGSVKVSARKYEHNSYLRVQWANFKAFRMYRKGRSPEAIRDFYFGALKHPKD